MVSVDQPKASLDLFDRFIGIQTSNSRLFNVLISLQFSTFHNKPSNNESSPSQLVTVEEESRNSDHSGYYLMLILFTSLMLFFFFHKKRQTKTTEFMELRDIEDQENNRMNDSSDALFKPEHSR